MKTKHFFYGLLTLAVLFTACKKDEKTTPVTSITLNYEELTLIPGDTITLVATVQPDDATNKTVTWTSNRPGVVTVNEEGLITAVANGEATIIATTRDGNKIVSCMITVDFRSQWVGDWEFTTNPAGQISYGEQSDVICIKFLKSTSGELVTVNESGKLLMIIPGETLYLYGEFEGANKVHFVFGEHSMGGPFKITVDGIKKEGDKK